MKNLLFLGLVLASVCVTTSCSDNKGPAETSTAAGSASEMDSTATPGTSNAPATTAATYIGTMDPEVVASQPGKCPKCGMDLVKK